MVRESVRASLRAAVVFCLQACGPLGFEVPESAFCYDVDASVYDTWPSFDAELQAAANNWGVDITTAPWCVQNTITLVPLDAQVLARHRGETMPYGPPLSSTIEINADTAAELMLAGEQCESTERWYLQAVLTFHLGEALGFVVGETDGLFSGRDLLPCELAYPSDAELALLRGGQ